jgi:hypothetical protein
MKSNLLPSFILVTGLFFGSLNIASSQVLEVTSETTPEAMVEILIGSGLSYDNVVYTGNDISRGTFWGGPGNIGVSNGIILTSGNVTVAPGPNNNGGAGADADQEGDIDLTTIAGIPTFDACVLEFDFVPEYNYTWFDYVFCSEEYHEYVNQFNDAFGFFISGPGISGPYSNNSKNIAQIPLSSVPVSINTVNCGNPYDCSQSCTNCQFFVNNPQGAAFTQYDAFTTVLTALAETVPMQTYHIKLTIGDGYDHVFDSGVFLQASSFCSGPLTGIGKNDRQGTGDNYQVYPVPAGDVLNISSQNGQNFDIQLIGQDGRCIKSASGNSQITIDISTVPSGIYFLRITDNSNVETRKIFKK